ncbi:hypothetical protein ANN_03707 [Periplaneta americana]|uniref:Uncharacterized protein n=1 Tax=Periplaneta americana TaxID=6978 RepID=A0ABQ8TZL5_PERAM|nr:hypothetical protein ANN_03707 [Periplaneta americana]
MVKRKFLKKSTRKKILRMLDGTHVSEEEPGDEVCVTKIETLLENQKKDCDVVDNVNRTQTELSSASGAGGVPEENREEDSSDDVACSTLVEIISENKLPEDELEDTDITVCLTNIKYLDEDETFEVNEEKQDANEVDSTVTLANIKVIREDIAVEVPGDNGEEVETNGAIDIVSEVGPLEVSDEESKHDIASSVLLSDSDTQEATDDTNNISKIEVLSEDNAAGVTEDNLVYINEREDGEAVESVRVINTPSEADAVVVPEEKLVVQESNDDSTPCLASVDKTSPENGAINVPDETSEAEVPDISTVRLTQIKIQDGDVVLVSEGNNNTCLTDGNNLDVVKVPEEESTSTNLDIDDTFEVPEDDSDATTVCLIKIKTVSENSVPEENSAINESISATVSITRAKNVSEEDIAVVSEENREEDINITVRLTKIKSLPEDEVPEEEKEEKGKVGNEQSNSCLDILENESNMPSLRNHLPEGKDNTESVEIVAAAVSVVNELNEVASVSEIMAETVPDLVTDMIASERKERGSQNLGDVVKEGETGDVISLTEMSGDSETGDVAAVLEQPVPSANESVLQIDCDDVLSNVVLLKYTHLDNADLEKLNIQTDSKLNNTQDDLEFNADLPVALTDNEYKVDTDKPVISEISECTPQLSENECMVDIHIHEYQDKMSMDELGDSSVVEQPEREIETGISTSALSVIKESTSRFNHNEYKELEEVEESVFVDEPCDGEEEEGVAAAELNESLLTCKTNRHEEVVNTASSSEEVVTRDNSGSSSEDGGPHVEIPPQPDCSTVSMDTGPIDPATTAAGDSCIEEIPPSDENKSVRQTVAISDGVVSEDKLQQSSADSVTFTADTPTEDNNERISTAASVSEDLEDSAVTTVSVGDEGIVTQSDGTDTADRDACSPQAGEMTVSGGVPVADDIVAGDVIVGEVLEGEIRSGGDPVMLATPLGAADSAGVAGEEQQGVSCLVVSESARGRDACEPPGGEPRYTSLVMITQNHLHQESVVSVVTSETTTLVPSADVIVRHTNWEEDGGGGDVSPVETTGGLAGYFTLTLETSGTAPSCKRPLVTKTRPQIIKKEEVAHKEKGEEVKVVTGGDTLSAVVCLEEGLADDDSWVEELDNREDEEFATTTPTEEDSDSGDEAAVSSATASSSYASDREEELRGYHRSAIDFTLHTIVEESCEESEVEATPEDKKTRPTSASELEKYFFYGLGGGGVLGSPPGGGGGRELDSFSDTCSSIYSEGLESLGADETAGGDDQGAGAEDGTVDPAELASSRLEKYFLTGFMGFSASDHNNRDSDGSGSVGSDSEGRPSPEQRRKRLVRARGTGRQHSSSLDNLVSGELSGAEQQPEPQESEDSSTETDTHHEDGGSVITSGFEKPDGQFDTVKRKKKKRGGRASPASLPSLDDKKDIVAKSPVGDATPDKILASSEELSALGMSLDDSSTTDDEEGCKTPQPEFLLMPSSELSASRNKQQSRDSGFIGSCDDLLKDQRTSSDSSSSSNNNDSPSIAPPQKSKQTSATSNMEEHKKRIGETTAVCGGLPVVEEGAGDHSKASHMIPTSNPPATALTRKDSFNNWSSDEETNLMMSKMRAFFKTMVAASSSSTGQVPQKTPQASPATRQRGTKPPQLVYFENELTRLMKTVPGIRDEQVREIVEYLSSEDTWSDSYDSSDYTSSDLEGAGAKTELQEQISASCQQIINKFDTSIEDDDDDEDKTSAGVGLNRDTAFVYQRLVASSPPLIAKVMHHIGSRLVALMHEVSGGEGMGAATSSPKVRYHHPHRRLQAKLSAASTTTDDDSHTDTEQGGTELPGLPRSKSHDLLLEPGGRPGAASSMELATSEASDYERFSWRGSFESALMAADSRTKLSLLQDSSNAASTAAKRRSAGDLLFAGKSVSREQLLDRVRSCGSIGGSVEDKIWNARRRRSSVPDANTCHAGSGTSADGDDDDDTDDDDTDVRSTTLPRSLQTSCSAGTNSLPRLPTCTTASPAPSILSAAGSMYKSHSVQHFGQGHVKSARYRPPGFNRTAPPKRAVSAPGLQPQHPTRGGRGEGGRRSRLQSNPSTPTPTQVSDY